MSVEVVQIGSGAPVQVVSLGPSAPNTARLTQYHHVQALAATVWEIQHNLGRRPAAVTLFSSDWTSQFGQFVVLHVSADLLRVSMETPTAGHALIE